VVAVATDDEALPPDAGGSSLPHEESASSKSSGHLAMVSHPDVAKLIVGLTPAPSLINDG
jgi:hypothetical protein